MSQYQLFVLIRYQMFKIKVHQIQFQLGRPLQLTRLAARPREPYSALRPLVLGTRFFRSQSIYAVETSQRKQCDVGQGITKE